MSVLSMLSVMLMSVPSSLPAGLEWTWVRAAGSYSAFAGVLAAFTIAAVLLVLGNPPEESRGNRRLFRQTGGKAEAETAPAKDAVASPAQEMRTASSTILYHGLLVAFVSLTITTLLFAILSGDDENEVVRQFFLGMLASSLLAFDAVQLLLCMFWCARAYRPTINLRGEHALFVGLIILCAAMVLVVHGDLFWVIDGVDWKSGPLDLTAWAAGLLVLMPLLGGYGARRVLRKVPPLTIYPWAIAAAAVFVALVAGTYAWLADATPESIGASYQLADSVAIMLLLGICLLLCVWSLPPSITTTRVRTPHKVAGDTRGQAGASLLDHRRELAPEPVPIQATVLPLPMETVSLPGDEGPGGRIS